MVWEARASSLGWAACQAVQKAASDVGTAQKTIQSGGAVAPAAQQQQQVQAAPAPPTININIPGLGGNNGAAQGPPGISYTPSAAQGTGQVLTASKWADIDGCWKEALPPCARSAE